MHHSHPLRAAVLLCLLGCGSSTPKAKVYPATQLTFGGVRPVTIQVPESYDNKVPTPLIILLHGYGAGGFVQAAYFSFDRLVNEAGVILAAPDGTVDSSSSRFWNATDACCNFDGSSVDDVAYISQLIRDISAEWNVDPKRIFLAGHSNGGFMSYRMACEHPELIAGIMVLAGGTWSDASKCHPSEAVSVLDIQGDADEDVHFDGGTVHDVPYPGARQSLSLWAGYDGCSGGLALSGPDIDIEDGLAGAETAVEQMTGCPPGVDLTLWTMRGAGHIPQVGENFRTKVWAWLVAHPKR